MCTANNASAANTGAAASSSFWKNPSFWKSAGSGLAVGAGIMGAAGQYIAGNAQRDSYYAQAAALESQAALSQQAANRQVKYDLQNAAQAVKEIRRAGRQNYAKQLTAAAGSGMDFSSVSLQDAVLDSLRAEKEDIDLIKRNASQQAYETQLQADLNSIEANSQAAQARLAGKTAAKAGRLNAFSSLLSSAGMVAGMWSK